MPLDHLVFIAREGPLARSLESETIGETILGKLQPSGHCTENRLKHTSCVKGLFTCSWALAWGTGFRFVVHLVGGHGETCHFCALPSPHYNCLLPTRQELKHHLEPGVLKPCSEDTSRAQITWSRDQQRLWLSHRGLCIFAYFRSCCLGAQL